MEELKNRLYESIEHLGINHKKTIKISQQLDLMIVEKNEKVIRITIVRK